MSLSMDEVARFNQDGYLLKDALFSQDEVAVLIDEIEQGSGLDRFTRAAQDAEGRPSRLAIWYRLEDDAWGAASTKPSIVNGVRLLLGEEAAFFHGKVMFKEARSGGAWEWHQDYGYWYNESFAFPRMISAFVALDEATEENGCLRVLRGSHKLGRQNHEDLGGQTGVTPERMAALVPLFDEVAVAMKPGSVLFFHCNLFHRSAPNESDKHRRSFIVCFNALNNPTLALSGWASEERRPCPTGEEDGALRFRSSDAPV